MRAIFQDHTGTLWVGTYGGGLYRLDPASGTFTPYRNDPANPNSLSDDRITGMVEDNAGQIWVATLNGLNRFDPVHGSFTPYRNDPANPNSVSGNYIWSITKDGSANIWIGTRGAGLNRIDASTGKITRYRNDPKKPSSLSDDGVIAVHVDRSGVVWAGLFGGGLDRLNLTDGTFSHYREPQGLASDEVLSITEDRTAGSPAGNLWIVTGHGLSRLSQDRKTFRTYDASDGLPSAQYSTASYTTRSGKLLIGTTQGLIMFDPASLHDAKTAQPPVFTDFLLDNKPVPIDSKSPLSKSINQADNIALSYLNRVVSFEFSALSYAAPQRIPLPLQAGWVRPGLDGSGQHAQIGHIYQLEPRQIRLPRYRF